MEKLKALRKQRKISQKEFANHMNVAQNTVSRWENGERLMDSDTLIKAAKYFDVSTDFIIGLTNNKKPDKLTKPEQILVEQFNNLNDIGKKEAIKRVSELTHITAYSNREMPIAAHNDNNSDEELELMQQDIDDL